jgi:hypothetical protein
MLRSLAGLDYHDHPSSVRLQGIAKQIQENFEWVSETDASSDLHRAMNVIGKTLPRL